MANPSLDRNQLAASIVAQTTGQPPPQLTPQQEKNPFAVALGRLGASKGGIARAEALTKKRRSQIAKKAAKARWSAKEE